MAGDWDLCGTWRLLRLVYLSDALNVSLAAIPSSICQVHWDRSGGKEHKWLEGEPSLAVVWKRDGSPKHSRADWNEGVEA